MHKVLKRILPVLLLIFIVQTASSQILIALIFGDKLNSEKLEFGLNVGANYGDITNLNHAHNQRGINIGMTFNYKFSQNFHLNPALYFGYPMGARGIEIYHTPDSNLNHLIGNATLNRELSYFSLPITLRYRLFGKTFIEAGPQISLLKKAQDIFEIDIVDGENIKGGNLTYEVNLRDKYTLFDFGVTGGITHKLREQNGVSLTLRYYYGLVDISKDASAPNQHNSVFYFSCGIPIGGNKKGENDHL
jgi:hypothetical protein